ncbi:hypothetical protein COCMIDRAFT_96899, partial [Bipolaris oryzae ATCC 44560]
LPPPPPTTNQKKKKINLSICFFSGILPIQTRINSRMNKFIRRKPVHLTPLPCPYPTPNLFAQSS